MIKQMKALGGFPAWLMAGGVAGMLAGAVIGDIPLGVIIGASAGGVLPVLFSGSGGEEADPPEGRSG